MNLKIVLEITKAVVVAAVVIVDAITKVKKA